MCYYIYILFKSQWVYNQENDTTNDTDGNISSREFYIWYDCLHPTITHKVASVTEKYILIDPSYSLLERYRMVILLISY